MRVGLLGPLEVSRRRPLARGRRGPVAGAARAARARRRAHGLARRARRRGLGATTLPADAVHALQSLVSRLRRALGDGGARGPDAGRLPARARARRRRRPPLRAARRARARARCAPASPAAPRRLLGEALALWRGPALAELAGTRAFATAAAARLEDAAPGRDRRPHRGRPRARSRRGELVAELERAGRRPPARRAAGAAAASARCTPPAGRPTRWPPTSASAPRSTTSSAPCRRPSSRPRTSRSCAARSPAAGRDPRRTSPPARRARTCARR